MGVEDERKRLGEVVESSTAQFAAQCYRLYEPPALGELVRVGSPPIYGVVYQVATQPAEPGRRVTARGADAASEDDVYRDNPQLSRLLHTYFHALIVGSTDESGPRHRLPPTLPRIHAFVRACSPEEVAEFTSSADFLHILLGSNVPMVDEVVAACLRRAAACHPNPGAFLVRAGKALVVELTGQLPRLNAVLRGMRP